MRDSGSPLRAVVLRGLPRRPRLRRGARLGRNQPPNDLWGAVLIHHPRATKKLPDGSFLLLREVDEYRTFLEFESGLISDLIALFWSCVSHEFSCYARHIAYTHTLIL